MIGDIIISLARKRKDKIEGTGRFHIMKNRYGADGMTFKAKINTSNGFIEVDSDPLDDDDIETSITNKKPVNDFSNVDVGGSGESSKKVYRRADLIQLQLRDPDRYAALSDEIMQAYIEKRVR